MYTRRSEDAVMTYGRALQSFHDCLAASPILECYSMRHAITVERACKRKSRLLGRFRGVDATFIPPIRLAFICFHGPIFLQLAWPRGSDVLKFRDATNVLTGSSTGEDTAPVFFFSIIS
jgi:hypothetical protein